MRERPVAPVAGLAALLCGAALPAGAPPAAAMDDDRRGALRRQFFGDRPIREGVVEVTAPTQADDAALVPITVRVPTPQAVEPHVKAIHVFVDRNPDPLVGVFRFTREAASLAVRVEDTKARVFEQALPVAPAGS
jgi:sulfur-oxidizing protein SoxY